MHYLCHAQAVLAVTLVVLSPASESAEAAKLKRLALDDFLAVVPTSLDRWVSYLDVNKDRRVQRAEYLYALQTQPGASGQTVAKGLADVVGCRPKAALQGQGKRNG